MMALTANLTTVDSRKSGVTRMWKRDREAKTHVSQMSANTYKGVYLVVCMLTLNLMNLANPTVLAGPLKP